jgi:hypothetical protein
MVRLRTRSTKSITAFEVRLFLSVIPNVTTVHTDRLHWVLRNNKKGTD